MKLTLLVAVVFVVAVCQGKKKSATDNIKVEKRTALSKPVMATKITHLWIRNDQTGQWERADPLYLGFNIFGFGAGIDIKLFENGAWLTIGGDITAFGHKVVSLSVELFGKHGLGLGVNAEVLGIINVEAGWGIGGQYGLYGKKLKIGVGDLTVIGAEYGIGGKYGLGVGAGVTLLGHDIKVVELGLGGVTVLNQKIIPGLSFGGSGGANIEEKSSKWDCWGPCHRRSGMCQACGSGGACCRRGWKATGCDAATANPHHHACQYLGASGGWAVGDGKGGSEFRIASNVASREACYDLCFKKRRSDHSINGVTFGVATGSKQGQCYCERGMSSTNGNRNWITIGFPSEAGSSIEGGWSVGDGKGGREFRIATKVSSQWECYELCINKRRTGKDKSINGVTYGVISGNRHGQCYCEKGMKTHNSNTDWITKELPAYVAGRCPETHPVVYLRGAYCCKHDQTKRGEILTYKSDSCLNDDWQKCKQAPCGDFIDPADQFLFQSGGAVTSKGHIHVGKETNAWKCAERCVEEQKKNSFVNAATFGIYGKSDAMNCYCNLGMYTVNKNANGLNYASTLLPLKNGVCTPCYCEEWDDEKKIYKKCKPYQGRCPSGFCAQCMSNGVTPMPGRVEEHDKECCIYKKIAKEGPAFKPLGCYQDLAPCGFLNLGRCRAIPHRVIHSKKDIIRKCYEYARDHGYSHFAVQNQDECWTGPNAGSLYNKYGGATGCRNGKGAGSRNDAYQINPHGYDAEKEGGECDHLYAGK